MAYPEKITYNDKYNIRPITEPDGQFSAENANEVKAKLNKNALFHGVHSNLSALQAMHPTPPVGAFAYLLNRKTYKCVSVGWVPEGITSEEVILALGYTPMRSDAITEVNISEWNSAFRKKIVAISITGEANKTLTLTREDGTILTASFIDNNDGSGSATDDVLNTLSFNLNNDGVLSAITSEGVTITASLDGRYSLLGHTHNTDELTEGTKKLVTQAEKNTWNGKQDALGFTPEKKRTIKAVPNTTQYTLVAADFTDYILDFTADGGESISIILNTGVAPAGGQIQAISSGNNFLVPTAGTGITLIRPEGTNLKTTAKGWIGIIPLSTANTFGVNGNLESTGGGSDYDDTEIKADIADHETRITELENNPGGGETYDVFTNTEDGLVPAPNVSASGYLISITSPTEGQTFTEGDTITLTSTVTASSSTKKVLTSSGWEEGATSGVKPFKQIDGETTYTLVPEDKNYWLLFRNAECVVTIPEGVFLEGEEIEGSVYSSPQISFVSSGQIVIPAGAEAVVKQGGVFGIKFLPMPDILGGAILCGTLNYP